MESRIRTALTLLAAISVSVAAAATPRESLNLREVLRRTLENDPAIRLARTSAEAELGRAAEARGLFDTRGEFYMAFERAKGELLPTQTENEFLRRELERSLIAEFTRVADDLQRQLDEGNPRPTPDCDELILVINGTDICTSDVDRNNAESRQDLIDRLIGLEDDPARRNELREIRDIHEELFRQTALNTIVQLRQQTGAAEERLRLLGEIPEIQERWVLRFDLRVKKPLRSGAALSAGVLLEGVEDNYDEKQLSAAHGGKGIPNMFRSFVGLAVEAPLGKGRGAKTVAAPSRSAELSQRAALHEAAHVAAERVLESHLAYLELAAAQERSTLLQDSLETNGHLYEVARELVEGDELPASSLDRVRARVATARAAAAQARRGAYDAAMRLADAMGEAVETPEDAPAASEAPADLVAAARLARKDERPLATRTREALAARADVQAARLRHESSKILLTGSERDLARRVDLEMSAGYAGLFESFGEQFYSPEGLWRSLTGDYAGLSVFFTLTTQAPFGNRAAKGQLAQSAALAEEASLQVTELDWQVGLRLNESVGALERAVRELARIEESDALQKETLEATLELFRAGEATLADTILTEEQTLSSALGLLQARQTAAALAARVRFESGELVRYRVDGTALIALVDLVDLVVEEIASR